MVMNSTNGYQSEVVTCLEGLLTLEKDQRARPSLGHRACGSVVTITVTIPTIELTEEIGVVLVVGAIGAFVGDHADLGHALRRRRWSNGARPTSRRDLGCARATRSHRIAIRSWARSREEIHGHIAPETSRYQTIWRGSRSDLAIHRFSSSSSILRLGDDPL
ncbi:hypothetical protein TIFTF001_030571 [Ficus carica]|uniref:Uncharacterized protein n=1 Tax=Ficus carica TaxID=3494 RepID=A0AA88DTU1_FICCA|nr:hypothetical protein TIFTF001_030571 [Ficus carica]